MGLSCRVYFIQLTTSDWTWLKNNHRFLNFVVSWWALHNILGRYFQLSSAQILLQILSRKVACSSAWLSPGVRNIRNWSLYQVLHIPWNRATSTNSCRWRQLEVSPGHSLSSGCRKEDPSPEQYNKVSHRHVWSVWLCLKAEERRFGAAGDKLEESSLLLLAKACNHLPEGGDRRVTELVTPGVVRVSLRGKW